MFAKKQYTQKVTPMIPQLALNFQAEISSSSSCMNCTPSSVVILDLFPKQTSDIGFNGSDLEYVDLKSSPEHSLVEDFPLGRFMRFLKHFKLKKLLSGVTDPRDQFLELGIFNCSTRFS